MKRDMDWAWAHRDDDAPPPNRRAGDHPNALRNDPDGFWAAYRLVCAKAKGHEAGVESDDLNLHLAKGNANLGRQPGSDGRPRLGKHHLRFSRFGRLFALAQST